MILEVFCSGPVATNSILFADPITKKAALVDTPSGCVSHWEKRLEKLELTLECILFTHSHWDHIADAAICKKKWDVPIWIHVEDAENLRNPGSDQLPCWISIQGVEPQGFLSDGQKLFVGNLEVHVLHTPGHTPGCVCFYLPKEKLVLSGDTLFCGSIGNLSFPTARPALMRTSLEKLMQLPADTVVVPGHGEETTIGDERQNIDDFF